MRFVSEQLSLASQTIAGATASTGMVRVPSASGVRDPAAGCILVYAAGGGRGSSLEVRREPVETEAARLVSLGAARQHTIVEAGLDHYAVAMTDPEGNEFDIN
jgi:Glyoxalase-like domain